MVYSWTATGPVIYDFHSEPEGAPAGYAESFDKAQIGRRARHLHRTLLRHSRLVLGESRRQTR